MEQIIAITNGKGVQYILDEAYRILGNPILTHDMEYKVIAYNENETDDPIWNEFMTTGMVGHDRLVFYRDECFFEMAADAGKITFLLSDKLKYDRLFGKLFTKDSIQIGCACMTATEKPFEEVDPILFEIVCDILNKEFCNSELYQSYGQAYMETLIGQLIENNIEDIGFYIATIESLYIGLKSILRVAVLDINQCNPTYTKLTYFRDIFKQAQPDFKYAVFSNYILILMSSDSTILHIEDLNKLYTLFEKNNMYIGISDCFENLFDLREHYKEAISALNHGLKNNGRQRIFLYDEMEHFL